MSRSAAFSKYISGTLLQNIVDVSRQYMCYEKSVMGGVFCLYISECRGLRRSLNQILSCGFLSKNSVLLYFCIENE